MSTRAQDIVGVIGGGSGGGSSNNSCSSAGSSKKREDLTSLGSDDSGKATARARTSRASLIQSEKTILHSHLSHTHFVFVVYYNFHIHKYEYNVYCEAYYSLNTFSPPPIFSITRHHLWLRVGSDIAESDLPLT